METQIHELKENIWKGLGRRWSLSKSCSEIGRRNSGNWLDSRYFQVMILIMCHSKQLERRLWKFYQKK